MDANPYSAPRHGADANAPATASQAWAYLPFWPRVVAFILDHILLIVLGIALGFGLVFSIDDEKTAERIADILGQVLTLAYMLSFWIARNATPGKMVFKAQIRRHRSLTKPSVGQYIGRYFAYILSTLPLGLGFLWAAFNKERRCWHDMLAGTVVVRPARAGRGIRPPTAMTRRPGTAALRRPGARPATDLPARREEA